MYKSFIFIRITLYKNQLINMKDKVLLLLTIYFQNSIFFVSMDILLVLWFLSYYILYIDVQFTIILFATSGTQTFYSSFKFQMIYHLFIYSNCYFQTSFLFFLQRIPIDITTRASFTYVLFCSFSPNQTFSPCLVSHNSFILLHFLKVR